MALQRPTFPLYMHIAASSVLLVLLGALAMRWFGDERSGWSMLAPLLGAAALLGLGIARLMSRSLSRLADETEAVRRFDFRDRPVIRSAVREVDQLAHSIDLLRDTVRRFLDLNLALAAEDDFETLLPRLLSELALAGDARAGVLYLANADGDVLLPGALHVGDTDTQRPALPELPLSQVPVLLRDAIASMSDANGMLTQEELRVAGLDVAFADMQVLAVPLINRNERVVGALLLFGEGALSATRRSFVTTLSASAALTLETRELVRDQKALFEALIRMVAGAIDAQSPYTGGHCERVPELTKLLARAACDTTAGPYADFRLDANEWEAVHIASWLHDCGKVTTPEYVVDKATKLETICDRIHEVRMRFEVLKRDAEIDYWRGVARGGDDALLRGARDDACAGLDDEFAFVARCNLGGEFLAPEQQARLRAIGTRTWMRTLDDRLGISREELERKSRSAPSQLPAAEPLLADKPEHRIPRPPAEGIGQDNAWGFRIDVPELLYDRGELHNLTVSRGTLSAEERFKINEHMLQTIIMLSRLPFPRHLQSVPEIAGGHHEKMDGTGYPRRLTREQMSPLARMMAIADIFEASPRGPSLQAGENLSQALAIW